MIAILIKLAYLLGTIIVGLYLYSFSSVFKKMGAATIEEINEDEDNEAEKVTASDTKVVNYFGTTIFISVGILIWALIAVTVGRIASEITNQVVLKWIVYVLMYFVFLRIPFGMGNKMVKRSFDFEKFPEKIIFSFTMILFYILSICCYDWIPSIFKWHLIFLS